MKGRLAAAVVAFSSVSCTPGTSTTLAISPFCALLTGSAQMQGAIRGPMTAPAITPMTGGDSYWAEVRDQWITDGDGNKVYRGARPADPRTDGNIHWSMQNASGAWSQIAPFGTVKPWVNGGDPLPKFARVGSNLFVCGPVGNDFKVTRLDVLGGKFR